MNQRRIRHLVLAVAVLATSMTFIDATALNQALPTIGKWFGATSAESLWIIGAYSGWLAITLLPAGILADQIGRTRLLACGILMFASASAFCAAAPHVIALIIGRSFQGVGAGLMLTGSLAVLMAASEPGQRGRTIGAWSACCAAATIVGPLMGGALAEAGWWQAIFWINLPLAALTLILLRLVVRDSQFRRVDSNSDRQSSSVAQSFSIWKSYTVRSALALTVLLDTAFYGLLLIVPLALINALGYRADQAAAAQLPILLMLILTCPIAGIWHDRKGALQPVCCGTLAAMFGLMLIATFGLGVGPSDFVLHLLFPFALIGAGMGLGIVGLSTTVMNGVGEELLGAGAAANALVARLAAAIAVATFGYVLLWYGVDMQNLSINEVQWKPAIRSSMGLAAAICAAVFIGGVITLSKQLSGQGSDRSLNRSGGAPS